MNYLDEANQGTYQNYHAPQSRLPWVITVLVLVTCGVWFVASSAAPATGTKATVSQSSTPVEQLSAPAVPDPAPAQPIARAATPAAVAVPQQAARPAPVAVPAPVLQAVASQSAPEWADATYGSFAPIRQTGRGDSIISLPVGAKAGIVTAEYSGVSNFIVNVLDSANQPTGDLLVNEIGNYSGITPYGFNSRGNGAYLQITADGVWTIAISPISAAPVVATHGSGDNVFLYEGSAGQLTATYSGSRNFIVIDTTGPDASMGLLINEIGAYSGTVPLTVGPAVVSINAVGTWTLVIR